jgi:hypothetical protein
LAIALLAGCYPSSPTTTQTYDLVITDYNPDYDFSTKTTFTIPDEVVVVTGDVASNPGGGTTPTFVTEPYNTQIINAIKSGLTGLGWTEVDTTANPDVWIYPTAMQSTTIVYYYDYWGYWGWYGGGYYGWYYPGYYPPYSSSYTTGSVFVAMTDRHQITADNELPVEWSFIVNGLLTGSTTSNVTSRISTNIAQAFKQSPYLAHN